MGCGAVVVGYINLAVGFGNQKRKKQSINRCMVVGDGVGSGP